MSDIFRAALQMLLGGGQPEPIDWRLKTEADAQRQRYLDRQNDESRRHPLKGTDGSGMTKG